MDKEDVLIDLVENVVNDAMFAHKHTFKMYDYLTHNQLTKRDVADFLAVSYTHLTLPTTPYV